MQRYAAPIGITVFTSNSCFVSAVKSINMHVSISEIQINILNCYLPLEFIECPLTSIRISLILSQSLFTFV